MASQLTHSQLRTVQKRNANEPNTNICHSHDFCDANMVMDEAFTSVFGRSILPDEGEMTEDDLAVFNAAWDIASARGFTNQPV